MTLLNKLRKIGITEQEFRVNDPRMWKDVLRTGTLGFGEAYMRGWWESNDLVGLYTKLIQHEDELKKIIQSSPYIILQAFFARFFNLQDKKTIKVAVQKHYDTSQRLYDAMLDKDLLMYSCGFFHEFGMTLEQAQFAKVDLIARKLGLKIGGQDRSTRVIDYGCGWGGVLHHLVENYRVSGVGITLSKDQLATANERFGHPHAEFRLQDYRDMPKTEDGKPEEVFDLAYSIGAFEHFGYKNYETFFQVVHDHLVDQGLFVLHTIGTYKTSTGPYDPFLKEYIFGNAHIPSMRHIVDAAEGRLYVQNVHDFGSYYAITLREWLKRFQASWFDLEESNPELFTKEFRNMWELYLSMCIAVFETGKNTLFQVVFSKGQPAKPYHGGWV